MHEPVIPVPVHSEACWRHCEQLGVSQVRLLLARQDLDEPFPGWRTDARDWLDARLARQGVYAYRGVLGAIALLSGLIAGLAWWGW